MPIYPNFYQTLTPCPVVELRGYAAANGLKGRLFAYLDFNGPTGTARDGLAEGMLALAIEQKKLAPGQPIIEAVSGPFATALTLAGLTAGHPVVLVMPEDAPALRQENLLRLGAQIQHSPARSGLAGARAMAAQTAAANGWYYTDWLFGSGQRFFDIRSISKVDTFEAAVVQFFCHPFQSGSKRIIQTNIRSEFHHHGSLSHIGANHSGCSYNCKFLVG